MKLGLGLGLGIGSNTGLVGPYGPELLGTVWGRVFTTPPNSTFADNGTELILFSDGTLLQFGQSGILTIGKNYRLFIETLAWTGPDQLQHNSNGNDLVSTGVGSKEIFFTADNVNYDIKRVAGTGLSITLDKTTLSVKEVL